jgi:hypothetical protein
VVSGIDWVALRRNGLDLVIQSQLAVSGTGSMVLGARVVFLAHASEGGLGVCRAPRAGGRCSEVAALATSPAQARPRFGDAVAPERDVDAIAVALVLATRVEGFDRSPVGERVEPDRPEPLVARQVLDWVAGRGQQAVIDQVGPAGMGP